MRRFAGVLRHREAGFLANCMACWKVPEERAEEVGEIFSSHPKVSHCYKRPTYEDWPYSVFTMVHGMNARECEDTIAAIKEETGVGKLILPNDHVDVILTTRRKNAHNSETLLRNVRVLAIGQLIEAKEGKKLAEGNTATLELTPQQAEELAAANSRGEISLVLRSIADIKGGDENVVTQVKVMRYGAKSRVGGVN